MKIENYYDRIDQYHAGELSTQERESFKRDLASNDELREAEELYRLSLNALDFGVEENLRKDLKTWDQESSSAGVTEGGRIVPMRRRLTFVLSAAAALALLVFFALPYLMPAPSADELFAAYYDAPTESSMRGGTVPQNALTEAKKALSEQRYVEAENGFSAIPAGDPLYVEAQYYLGHALLGTNDPTAAKNAFEVAANSNEVKFKEKGEWNYLMACLKTKRWDVACESKLKSIAQDENNSFSNDAREILKKMK